MNTPSRTRNVSIRRKDFEAMLRFACSMHRLESMPAYAAALHDRIPSAARYDPGISSVLMGYDFHLTPEGPMLIEINNNAGGLYLHDGAWLPQPQIPELTGSLKERLDTMFPQTWQRIAIMDENVTQQYMYPEMRAYAELLAERGRELFVVSPEEIIEGKGGGLYIDSGRIDAIYNRHTDFYLETAELAHIRRAYLAGLVALTPHPRSYALLGDKGRMVDWWHEGMLEPILPKDEIAFIRSIVPEIHYLDEVDAEKIWAARKEWVFKPAARHGGKGVLLGKSLGQRRFSEMEPSETVVQHYVPPSTVTLEGSVFKLDVRLYMHGESLIAVAGRVWRGQVTNFRTPGSGFVPLSLE